MNTSQKQVIDTTLRMSIDSAVYDKIFAFYAFMLHTEQAGLQNLFRNQYNITKVNYTQFTKGEYIRFQAGGYYKTGFIPSTSGINIDSMSVGFVVYADTAYAFIAGCKGAYNSDLYFAYQTGGTQQMNFSANANITNNWMNADKVCIVTRLSDAYFQYNDGLQKFTGSHPHGILSNKEFEIEGYNNNGSYDASPAHSTQRIVFIGRYLNATDVRKMTNICKYLMSRRGVFK
jgi:hypothetical protein